MISRSNPKCGEIKKNTCFFSNLELGRGGSPFENQKIV